VNIRGLLEVPNLLSLLRIVLIPVFLYFIFIPTMEHRLWALIVFLIASLTDFLDGWFARRLHQESDLGRFLDPLADKVLVIAALSAFLVLDPFIPLWMVVIIVGRDVLITLMRYLAIRKGTALVTSSFGKVKTAFQMVSIIVIIMVFVFRRAGVGRYATDEFLKIVRVYEIMTSSITDKWLIIGPYCLMLIVTILTAFSGIRYMMTNWRLFLPPYSKRDSAA
jgi:cardiolipin synthase